MERRKYTLNSIKHESKDGGVADQNWRVPEQRSDDQRVMQSEEYLFVQKAANHMGCRVRKKIHRTGKNRSDTIRRDTSDQGRIRVTASRNNEQQWEMADHYFGLL